MNIVCLDLEGVLVPEIWIAFAEASGIPELKRTTRDEPDYDKLMRWRLQILKEIELVMCILRLKTCSLNISKSILKLRMLVLCL